jgi:hypothetical protein
MKRALALTVFVALAATPAFATDYTLPNASQQTTLTATVAEQAHLTVPVGVSFSVNDVTSSTDSGLATVGADSIALLTGHGMKISLQANAASFSAPGSGTPTTWGAGDVSWNAPTWASATGAEGTLSNTAYTEVATCDVDSESCGTEDLKFTLAQKDHIQRAGNHTLAVTWKFESVVVP